MKGSKTIRETYSETYKSKSNPIDTETLQECLNKKQISGYVQRAGKLSDGKSFAVVYIIIDESVKQ